MNFEPESGKRKYHRAKLIGAKGAISPLCADPPRAIDTSSTSDETWTIRDEQVTCPACIERLKAQGRR